MRRNIQTVLNLLMIAFLTFIFIIILKSNYRDIIIEICKTSWMVLIISIILFLIYFTIRSYLYTDTVKQFSRSLPLRFSILYSFFCSFYDFITLGAGSIVCLLYFYKKHDILETETMGIQFYQYLIFKVVQLILGNLAVFLQLDLFLKESYLFKAFLISDIISIVIVIGCVILCTSKTIHRFMIGIGNKIIKRETWKHKIKEYDCHLTQLRNQFPYLFQKQFILRQFWFILSMYIIYYTIPYVILYNTGISYFACFTLISIVNVIAGVLVFPGGIGSVEVSYLLLFSPVVGKISALSSLLVYRFMTYLLPILIGGFLVLTERLWNLFKHSK